MAVLGVLSLLELPLTVLIPHDHLALVRFDRLGSRPGRYRGTGQSQQGARLESSRCSGNARGAVGLLTLGGFEGRSEKALWGEGGAGVYSQALHNTHTILYYTILYYTILTSTSLGFTRVH